MLAAKSRDLDPLVAQGAQAGIVAMQNGSISIPVPERPYFRNFNFVSRVQDQVIAASGQTNPDYGPVFKDALDTSSGGNFTSQGCLLAWSTVSNTAIRNATLGDLVSVVSQPNSVTALDSWLEDSDSAVRVIGFSLANSAGIPDAHELDRRLDGLVDGTQNVDPAVRAAAIISMQRLAANHYEALERLLALSQSDDTERLEVIPELGPLAYNHPAVLAQLLAGARNPNISLRVASIGGLGDSSLTANSEVTKALRDAQSDVNPIVQLAAVQAETVFAAHDAPTLEALVGRYSVATEPYQIALMRGLASAWQEGNPTARLALLNSIERSLPEVKIAALESLSSQQGMSDPQVVSTLLDAAQNSNSGVKIAALRVVSHLAPDPSLMPVLLTTAQDPSESVRAAAITALGAQLGPNGGQAAASLIGAASEDPSPIVRAAAFQALPEMSRWNYGQDQMYARFRNWSGELDPAVRLVQIHAMRLIMAVNPALPLGELVWTGEQDKSAEVREATLEAIMPTASMGDGHAQDVLTSGLEDPDPEVRKKAALLLETAERVGLFDSLTSHVLAYLGKDLSADQKEAAIDTLASIVAANHPGAQAAKDAFLLELTNPDPTIRGISVRELPRATNENWGIISGELGRSLLDPDAEVRHSTLEAITAAESASDPGILKRIWGY
jgi:HEAT repeat protein